MTTIEFIQKTVADHYGFTVANIQSKSRKHELVLSRQIAHYFSKKFTNENLSLIGLVIGNKDHSTVIHSIKTVNNLIDTDKNARLYIEEIENKIKSGLKYKSKDDTINELRKEIERLNNKVNILAAKNRRNTRLRLVA